MTQNNPALRRAHTHHITMVDATVTALTNVPASDRPEDQHQEEENCCFTVHNIRLCHLQKIAL